MAQSLKDIRRRIRSVRNIRKITAAMKMVAAAKLRRAQQRAEAGRPYAESLRGVLLRLASNARGVRHPFLEERPGGLLAVVVTSDRGLAGPYNANLARTAEHVLRQQEERGVLVVGRKGRDYFRRRKVTIAGEFIGLGDEARFEDANAIAGEVVRLFLEGHYGQVQLVYAQFVNAMTSRPVSVRLLPLSPEDLLGQSAGPAVHVAVTTPGQSPPAAAEGAYIFEPDAATVLAKLLPHYLSVLIYRALLEAKASEHGARMVAMDSATKNAGDLIDRLELAGNRMRQAAITKEIAEIVGGANALRA